MKGGGELRTQSQYTRKDKEYRTEHVEFEASIRYPGEHIHEINGNKHLKLWRYQSLKGS